MALGKLKHLGKNITMHKNHVISGKKCNVWLAIQKYGCSGYHKSTIYSLNL